MVKNDVKGASKRFFYFVFECYRSNTFIHTISALIISFPVTFLLEIVAPQHTNIGAYPLSPYMLVQILC